MIKFDVTSRFSGEVKFTAEIDCEEGECLSVKLGHAVSWANLTGADLTWANLTGADLTRADLTRVDLTGANLTGANLTRADLTWANLTRADLTRVDLAWADLTWANLTRADLTRANLTRADLTRANLTGANLTGADGVNDFVKCMYVETYPITYTSNAIQIGCERHAITEWAEFDDKRILEMDGKSALKFWRKYKAWIFQTIDLAPAMPTKTEEAA